MHTNRLKPGYNRGVRTVPVPLSACRSAGRRSEMPVHIDLEENYYSVCDFSVTVPQAQDSRRPQRPLRTLSLMPSSHRPPDKTRRSCLCRVWCADVNWTIAVNAFRFQIFCRRQSRVVGTPIHTAEADATQTGEQFCRVWCGGVN